MVSRLMSSPESSPERPPSESPGSVRAVHILAGVCALGAAWTLGVFWLPLILGAWVAQLARPIYRWLSHAMKGRGRSASLVTVLLVVTVLSPIVIVLLALTGDALELVEKIENSPSTAGALAALLEDGSAGAEPAPVENAQPAPSAAPSAEPETKGADSAAEPGLGAGFPFVKDPAQLLELVKTHGAGALGIAGRVLGATLSVLVGLVIFISAFFSTLIHGREILEWLQDNSPLPRAATDRMVAAFQETGRGLIAAVGLTALLQGAVAGIGYLVVGVPHGLVLGMLTAIAALVPSIGTGLVWAPIAGGLVLSGRSGAAIAIVVIGVLVSSIDNVLRPLLSRIGKLQLQPFVLFLAMLGGMAAFGPEGVLLGPLLVRLAVEAIALSREHRA
jgi:predicted PurR-regulated permease PerM